MAMWRALFLAGLVISVTSGCSGGKSDSPYVFLPKQVAEDGTDLEAMRVRYCHGRNVTIDGDLLTKENFRAVYDCANYDGKLSAIGPLLTNEQFPAFLQNVNRVLETSEKTGVKETLQSWLEEGPEGTSRADRLLPVLASVIKNPSFQDGLPLLSAIFSAGDGVWNELLPGLAEVVYQERYPDNFDDLFTLFKDNGTTASEKNYAKTAKDWAAFLKSPLGDKTVAMRALEVADDVRHVKMGNTTPQEYLDQANEKGVFVSLFLESGAVRGEQLDPSLNAEPTPGEADDGGGPGQTPEQRRVRAYQKLFTRGPKGERAPIMDLIALVDEFQKDHQDFVPALGRWFKANGARIGAYLSEYVMKAQLSAGLKSISVASYLSDYAESKEIDIDEPMEPAEFVEFLKGAFADPKFSEWLEPQINDLNVGQLGPKNARMLSGAPILATVLDLYARPEVAQYGTEVYKLNPPPKTLDASIRKYSNFHRDEARFVYKNEKGSLTDHLLDSWWKIANDSLGENVVLDFVIPLVGAVVEEATAKFGKDGRTLSEWYFASPYANPSTTETLAGYAFHKFSLLEKYHQNYDFLMNKLPEEVFKSGDAAQDAANKRAYRALLGQLPNIWLYWRSGMSRSGNDLTRAMASKDKGYLIKNYVALLVDAYGNGFAEKVVDLMGAYMRAFPESLAQKDTSDELEDRRKASQGADAMKRVLRSLFRPEVKGQYNTSTLGRLLQPLSTLVAEEKRAATERFLLTSADEVLSTPDDKINDFFRDFGQSAKPTDANIDQRRETLHAVSDAMKKPEFPTLVRQVNGFFQADAIKPALDYLAKRIDDGALPDVLRFVRRVLGFKGK